MIQALFNFFSHPIFLDTLTFLIKGVSVTVLGIIFFGFIFSMKAGKKKSKKKIRAQDLGKELKRYSAQLKAATLSKKAFEKSQKLEQKRSKDQEKKNIYSPVVYVIDFKGNVEATQVDHFRDEVSAVLNVADMKKDQVIVRVESRGGTVHGYGLAASQLQRFKDKKIPLTICVDKVAASGGYMMACVANHIIAAPFAIVGSIGVYAGIPNMHRFLKKHDVDFEEITAGEYKRTISTFGAISEKGRKKMEEQLEDTHQLFKAFVKKNRPSLDINKVATGEYWYGIRAKELGLVDEIRSSDDYIIELIKNKRKVMKVQLEVPQKWVDKLGMKAEQALSKVSMLKNMQQPDHRWIQDNSEKASPPEYFL